MLTRVRPTIAIAVCGVVLTAVLGCGNDRTGAAVSAGPESSSTSGARTGTSTEMRDRPALATPVAARLPRIAVPSGRRLYHGVYPGGKSGAEDDITAADVASYERTTRSRVAWVYFSHNWYESRAFPTQTAAWIRKRGSVPWIRLMMREDAEDPPESTFTLQRIVEGEFDADLAAWARGARAFRTPLIVEFGTEVNAEWFPWNGRWNGAGTKTEFGRADAYDGAERFVAAYRRIVSIARAQGATNITWVFHVNDRDYPSTAWNRLERYYPGDGYVDWLAFSAYGTLGPTEQGGARFRSMADSVYRRLARMSKTRPIVIAEFGTDVRNRSTPSAAWTKAALADTIGRRWPRVIGFAWWNERWENDDVTSHDTTLRVQESPTTAKAFRDYLKRYRSTIAQRPTIR